MRYQSELNLLNQRQYLTDIPLRKHIKCNISVHIRVRTHQVRQDLSGS